MAREIERKFRVVSDAWRDAASRSRSIEQAYIADTDKAVVRVRIEDEASGILTIKSRGAGLARDEFEYEIPLPDARALMRCRQGAVLRKTRYDVPHEDVRWEVDVYAGDNDGLVIAEVELRSEGERPPRPAFIGPEVTGESRYYASELAKRPYREWPAAERV